MKTLYITVLTAFALPCSLAYAADLNLLLLLLTWLVDIAVILTGELIGTRVGRRSLFGEKYGANIGAGVSSLIMLSAYVYIVSIVPEERGPEALRVFYYTTGMAALSSLVINGCNIAAKKIVTFRARHGAPPVPELTLKSHLPYLFAASGTGVLNAAQIITFFALGMWTPMFNCITSALDIAMRVQLANVIGIFINRLVEKRLANNILIAAAAIFAGLRYVKMIISNDPERYFQEEYMIHDRLVVIVCALVIAADIVWAVLKLHKGKGSINKDNAL